VVSNGIVDNVHPMTESAKPLFAFDSFDKRDIMVKVGLIVLDDLVEEWS